MECKTCLAFKELKEESLFWERREEIMLARQRALNKAYTTLQNKYYELCKKYEQLHLQHEVLKDLHDQV